MDEIQTVQRKRQIENFMHLFKANEKMLAYRQYKYLEAIQVNYIKKVAKDGYWEIPENEP